MLDNHATPYYYGIFRDKVLRGEILVNKYIEMEMNRIDSFIENPNIYYDAQAIDGFVKFCNRETTLTDGSNLELLDTFKLWAEQIFGWYYYIEKSVPIRNPDGRGTHYETRRIRKRLINKQYLIIPRGAAKSMYASEIQNYFLNCDKTSTHQITTAPTMKQADEILSPIRVCISRARGPLMKFLTQGSINNTTGSKADRVKLASTKKGIQNFINESLLEVRPMSVDKLQGLRCKIATVDEWLSSDIKEDPIEAIEQGASKNPDYLIVAVSSEGTIRNGPGDNIKMKLLKILKGEFYDPHTSIWWYSLDDIKEVGDPNMWLKANPNIDKTVSSEVYYRAVEEAQNNPAQRNDILAKRFNLPMEGFTYFFTFEETKCHPHRDYWGMPCSLGADLSQGDDFCAFTFMFPLKVDEFGIKCRSYITERTLMKLPISLRQKYEEFINEGSLIVMNGNILDLNQVYDDLSNYIEESQYDVRCFGFDPYNAKEFVEKWSIDNGPFGVVKVIQGSKTESVPLGELKILAEQKGLLHDQSLMQFTMGNCITIEDNNGNRKLLKKRREEKIDNVSAMMDAYVAYKQHKDDFE